MTINIGNSDSREFWWVINNTSSIITIGDLFKVPPVKPGQKVDLLRYYSKDEISDSLVLKGLINSGSITIKKVLDGSSTTSTNPDSVVSAEKDELERVFTITNDVDDYVITAKGDGTLNGEPNLTFDGTNLTLLSGSIISGSATTGQSFINSGLVVNESGGSASIDDFRVETSSNSNAFIVDASANQVLIDIPTLLTTIKSGATQGTAGAAANEIWKTASHETLPNNTLMIGV